ncbi:MAG: aldo/keto reductase, partial [Mycobacterium sp.]|nr:aldo/keto reductase [Mycobacterium sp.]
MSTTVGGVPLITLNDGHQIPQLGFGTYQVPPDEAAGVVRTAVEIGYRHIDTAQMYCNEKGVGQGIRDAGIDRGHMFITTKLNNDSHRPDDARRAFDESLSALGTDYVDLFLIHWPLPTRYDGDFVSTWKTLEEFRSDGRARSIGVSNFEIHHLQELARETRTVPAVNQIEVHPYLTNDAVRAYGVEHDIITEGWSPIARGDVLTDPVVQRVSRATGAHPAQVVLRWHVERGDVVFPKSMHPKRMRENFEIFDFEINDEEIEALTALDRAEKGRQGPH